MTNAPQKPPSTYISTEQLIANFTSSSKSGVITVINWTMASDGETYTHFYSDSWRICIDKMFPIDGFHSTEKWQLLAIKNNKIIAIFPGCQVKSFIVCNKCPNTKNTFNFN